MTKTEFALHALVDLDVMVGSEYVLVCLAVNWWWRRLARDGEAMEGRWTQC